MNQKNILARAIKMVTMKESIEMRSGILTFNSSLRNILDRYKVEYRTFKGAVIDLETEERPFLDELCGAARYKNCSVCCGILDKNKVEIIAKTYNVSDDLFVRVVDEKVKRISHPYYAFNVGCDMALLSKLLGREIRFDRELQKKQYESKRNAVQTLGMPNFDDPFNGDGRLAAKAWTKHVETHEKGCVENIIAHNCACLLKEYSILVRRGYREIEPSSCKAFFEGKNELVFEDCARTL